jgi:anti-sigma factor (TIGR02949 family)
MNRSDHETHCDEALELLEPYLDGDLSPAGSSGLRAHLESCPSCAAELALAAKIQRELRSLPQLDCPPEVVERVRDAGRGEVVPFRPRRALGLRIAAAAAVLLLAVGGGALFLRFEQRRQEIAQATAEARYALAMLGKVTRRTSRNLREEVLEKRLVEPANRSVFRSLGEIPSLTAEPAAVDERSGKEL